MMSADGPDADPASAALVEVALFIAQALHERDPNIAESINFAAGKAYNRLRQRGEKEAAEIVYRFGRALLDHSLFPPPEESSGEET